MSAGKNRNGRVKKFQESWNFKWLEPVFPFWWIKKIPSFLTPIVYAKFEGFFFSSPFARRFCVDWLLTLTSRERKKKCPTKYKCKWHITSGNSETKLAKISTKGDTTWAHIFLQWQNHNTQTQTQSCRRMLRLLLFFVPFSHYFVWWWCCYCCCR